MPEWIGRLLEKAEAFLEPYVPERLRPFLEFAKSAKAIAKFVGLLDLIAPLAGLTDIAPPWPEGKSQVLIAYLVQGLVWLRLYRLYLKTPTDKGKLEEKQKQSLWCAIVWAAAYAILYALLVYNTPTGKVVGSFWLSGKAKQYLEVKPGTSIHSLLRKGEYHEEEVFEPYTTGFFKVALFGVFLLIVAYLARLLTFFLIVTWKEHEDALQPAPLPA